MRLVTWRHIYLMIFYLIILTVQTVEDNNHFLLICPKFNNLRLILLDSIQTLIPKNNNIDINIDLLLHGNRSFSYDLNTEIFQVVHKFIIDTHRFI